MKRKHDTTLTSIDDLFMLQSQTTEVVLILLSVEEDFMSIKEPFRSGKNE